MSFEQWLENASYEEPLRRWRFAPVGDPAFAHNGGTGKLFSEALARKKAELSNDEQVQASKNVGWG